MESLILLLVPIVVSLITQLVKSANRIRFSENKNTILRFFAGTASFIGVVAINLADGGEIPVDDIAVYAEALIAFLATQIPYWLAKSKK